MHGKFSLARALLLVLSVAPGVAQMPDGATAYGPYNAVFLDAGTGLAKPLAPDDVLLDPGAQWSIYGWVRVAKPMAGNTVIAVVGNPEFGGSRGLGTYDGKLALYAGREAVVRSDVALTPGSWHLVVATFSSEEAHLYADAAEAGHGPVATVALAPLLNLAPTASSINEAKHFGGELAGLTLMRRALAGSEITRMYRTPPGFNLAEFENGSIEWPVQTRGQAGLRAPQDPSTFPHSNAPPQAPVAPPLAPAIEALTPGEAGQWVLRGGWKLQAAPKVNAAAEVISSGSYDPGNWMQALVPGTVLTTMVARGLYPDPDYGLNNLAIPESLNKQDYWYRKEFPTPAIKDRQNLILTFEGINYAASVWLNGQHLGEIRGAFIRGSFDVTTAMKKSGMNVIAVRISPPPHPGIPQEQSIKGGPGDNGGIMALDGPTFAATEGWDWIPGVRDRNSGIWQDVTLTASGAVRVGDVQVITTLPQHDGSEADVEVDVPLSSRSKSPLRGELHVSFDEINVTKTVTVSGEDTEVRLSAADYAQLKVRQPRLWWPNGYGDPALHSMKVWFTAGGRTLSEKRVRFGMREISYELSLLDTLGNLRRVEFAPSVTRGEKVVSQAHDALRQTSLGWVASLYPGAENSRSLRTLADLATAPYLVIRVNGVRIACKGGNWGMDDYRKRVSREHLEPFFRLHREAHLNMIRNWMGQDTEQVFYDLADEYGQLVWNDFWVSTQNYNLEPADPALFLANAKDTILRFRNHPSIAVWCGRNEGVPPGIINQGLEQLVREVDGTRYYSASSNQVNLQNSGPYSYKPPSKFFTTLNRGFSVEVGTPSMSTLESFEHTVAPADQWPVSDAWAYHDWHQSGNGDVAPFMQELATEFGEATSLADFERKAQMLNYVDHRAIFEGFNAHLWAPNSGRLLWMTQPAWPSTMWQIFSSDYDTQASFYGVKKGAEPVHVQMNLPDLHAAIVNNTGKEITGATLMVKAVRGDGANVFDHQETVSAPPQAVTTSYLVDVGLASANDVVFVEMELRDAQGSLLSQNFYWYAADGETYRGMNRLPQVHVTAQAVGQTNSGGEAHVSVTLQNSGLAVAVATKLTLLRASDGERILPAYYSDNYVSLLPEEKRVVEISYPDAQASAATIAIRGWNVVPARVEVQPK
jgi:Exo-beta-D-glucosaminidase Ig-fold domain/Glycosyl hydrolases family 2/Concanavalin A-like lectin/glucanases superfamily/Glycosyl hydrolases family 2, sugar binding domain/Glycosyl hydrolases family 2, TIM barrel domain